MKHTKKIFACFLAVLITLSCVMAVSVGAAEITASESASVYNPEVARPLPAAVDGVITINSANAFMAFAEKLNSGENFAGITIKLGCDIVINQGDASSWEDPIQWNGNGNSWANRFAGNFDGQGHVISGIYNVNGNNAGLFGRIDGGTEIKNLCIVNSYFESNGTDTGVKGLGALIGSLDPGAPDQVKTTKISNVFIESTTLSAPTGRMGVGGIVGATTNFNNSTLIIENCSFKGTINAANSSCVGGIVGMVKYGKNIAIESCAADFEINCGNEAAGLVGRFESCAALQISNCLSKGTINANNPCTNGNSYYRTGSLVGVIDLWSGVDATVKIDTVLAAVKCNSHEFLIATIRGDNNVRTVTFEIANVLYNEDLQKPLGLIRRDNYPAPKASVNGSSTIHGTNWNLESQYKNIGESVDFGITAAENFMLKNDTVFSGWILVQYDYPVPVAYVPPVTPEDPTPEDPTPEDPTPEDPTPEDPTPEDPTPEDPTPEDPTPEDPTPEEPTTETPKAEEPTTEKSTTTAEAPATDASAEKKGGCGSTVGMAGISVLALVAAIGVALLKKKERN